MFIKKIKPAHDLTSFASLRAENSTQTRLLKYEIFLDLVQYERCRADRLGDVFSLVIIDSNFRGFNLREISMIEKSIHPQLRSIDYMGWYGKNALALLLPLTDNRESNLLTNRIKKQISKMGIFIETSCHSYPENWFVRKENQGNLEYTPWSNAYKENEVVRKVSKNMPPWKRVMDIILSAIILILCLPLLLSVTLYIKIISPGPVLFIQDRVGHRGKIFKFYKFRSMHCRNDETFHGNHAHSFISDGSIPMVKLDICDSRIIKGGGILRSSCIDELPQLFNVLRGDMSLIGPRPCIPYEAEEYLRWHTHRFDTVPGISGLWQVSGKNDLSFKEMVRLDIAYSQKITPWNDIKIMLKTIPTIFKLVTRYFESKKRRKKIHVERVNNDSFQSAIGPSSPT